MIPFEKLYDEMENANVRFIGFTDGQKRFDFGIVYTTLFFGKPLVICLQSNCSALFDPNDLENIDYIQSAFNVREKEEAAAIAEFLKSEIPATPFEPQYEQIKKKRRKADLSGSAYFFMIWILEGHIFINFYIID